ncbi:peptide-methionine (R)-S-oxide reductase MsrB [Arhodomonas sp. SL1]|uniref:peptide-methionine (R)-S-oxide reductase MsrB n=1 Tax=Arhodomonas sp. SL1 TaxID=3425691 RepID=UPI003F883DA9
MRRRRLMTLLLATPVLSLGLARLLPGSRAAEGFPFQLSESEWRQRLGDKAYAVLREEDTEPPGSSPLLEEKRTGTYACAGCGQDLFRSETKYDSGTGWPSFYDVIDGAVGTREDRSLFLGTRTEVHCSRCGGHLGHVFEDGPPPTGLRYCINGLALEFRPQTGAAG